MVGFNQYSGTGPCIMLFFIAQLFLGTALYENSCNYKTFVYGPILIVVCSWNFDWISGIGRILNLVSDLAWYLLSGRASRQDVGSLNNILTFFSPKEIFGFYQKYFL